MLLEVIAGADGLDPRQYAPVVHPYTESLGKGVDGLRIAVVQEGFGHPKSERDVDEKVKKAAELLGKMGAKITEVSIPWHHLAGALWLPIGVEGLTQTMMWGDGYGLSRPDLYVTSLMDFHRGWRQRANELSETTKLFTMLGTYIHKNHGSRYYGKAMNITRKLIEAYDAVLAQHDLLLMPTTPMKAQPMPKPGAAREETVGAGARDDQQYRAVRHLASPGHGGAVRHESRATRQHDAGRQALGRADDLPGRRDLRGREGLEEDVATQRTDEHTRAGPRATAARYPCRAAVQRTRAPEPGRGVRPIAAGVGSRVRQGQSV